MRKTRVEQSGSEVRLYTADSDYPVRMTADKAIELADALIEAASAAQRFARRYAEKPTPARR